MLGIVLGDYMSGQARSNHLKHGTVLLKCRRVPLPNHIAAKNLMLQALDPEDECFAVEKNSAGNFRPAVFGWCVAAVKSPSWNGNAHSAMQHDQNTPDEHIVHWEFLKIWIFGELAHVLSPCAV